MMVRTCHRRAGFALLLAIGSVAAIALFAGAILRMTARAGQIARNDETRVQAAWLAEAGIERAAARLAVDANAGGEVWKISADKLDGRSAGRVDIEIERDPDRPGRRRVRSEAAFPDDPARANRVTKHVLIDLSRLPKPREPRS